MKTKIQDQEKAIKCFIANIPHYISQKSTAGLMFVVAMAHSYS